MDTQKDPEIISGRMTFALSCYSAVFARYALAVTPKNYLLFGCHVVNFSAQVTQGYRFVNYWYMGGRDKVLANEAKHGIQGAKDQVSAAGKDALAKAEGLKDQAVAKGQELVGKK